MLHDNFFTVTLSVKPLRKDCINVGAQLRNQPILRLTIAQLRNLSLVAHLTMG